jgi:hypothetical protein
MKTQEEEKEKQQTTLDKLFDGLYVSSLMCPVPAIFLGTFWNDFPLASIVLATALAACISPLLFLVLFLIHCVIKLFLKEPLLEMTVLGLKSFEIIDDGHPRMICCMFDNISDKLREINAMTETENQNEEPE